MFKEYLQKIKDLNLPPGKFAIFGSGPMSVRNIRESRDADLIVAKDVFEVYRQKEGWDFKKFERDERFIEMLEKDNIELYKNWGPGDWDVEKLIQESEVIDGLPFVRLKEVLKWKEMSGRDKDKQDVELIKNYLKN